MQQTPFFIDQLLLIEAVIYEPVYICSFRPFSSVYENINSWNISHMVLVILSIFLGLERKSS